jgi:hypothetical protein
MGSGTTNYAYSDFKSELIGLSVSVEINVIFARNLAGERQSLNH